MVQADGSIMQTDDIHSVNLLGTSWACCFTFKWLVSIQQSNYQHAFTVLLKPSTFPSSTCLDLLRLFYMLFVQQQCLKYSALYHICTGSSCTCFAAAAIIYNNNNQQQQFSSVADLFAKTKYINIVISITMLKSSESCQDRTIIIQWQKQASIHKRLMY